MSVKLRGLTVAPRCSSVVAQSASLTLLPTHTVADCFSRAADGYDAHAVFQHPSARRLAAYIPTAADGHWLDLGCGTSAVWPDLLHRAPHARWFGIDLASGMLKAAQQRQPEHGFVQADAYHLPVRSSALQGVFSNLMAQWLCPQAFLAEQYRVLAPGGALLFTTLLQGSLHELRLAYERADRIVPVNPQRSESTYLSAMASSGLTLLHWQVIPMTHYFADLRAVFQSLKGTGAVASTVDLPANRAPKNPRGLSGRQWWQAMQDTYPKTDEGKYPLTFNIGYAVLRKPL